MVTILWENTEGLWVFSAKWCTYLFKMLQILPSNVNLVITLLFLTEYNIGQG